MNQLTSGSALQGSITSAAIVPAYAAPGRGIAGFTEARVNQIAAFVELRDTASAYETSLLLNLQRRKLRDRSASKHLLKRASEKTGAILGAQAERRLKRLATYGYGWDEGSGLALTEYSLLGLLRLLELGDWTDLDVALFLSRKGRVLVNWPDAKGEIVELEVAKDYLTCFIASTGEERALPIDAQVVSAVLARSR